jgi:hypothetical protein
MNALADRPECFFEVQGKRNPAWSGEKSGSYTVDSMSDRLRQIGFNVSEFSDDAIVLLGEPLSSPLWRVSIDEKITDEGMLVVALSAVPEDGVAGSVSIQPYFVGRVNGSCELQFTGEIKTSLSSIR